MYEAYFHLQRRPFSATPDPACFFVTDLIRELFDELILRAESGQGIGVLTAAAGTGKTLICRRIATELSGRLTPVFLANANFPTRRALLQSILFELGRRYSGLEEQELRLAVFASLKELTLAGRGAVLIVDEAHLLNERLLEELRLLASLAEGEEPLARVILAGQIALEERLTAPALEALNQRVICQVYLEPLTRQESIDYVNFRMEWAGSDGAAVFTPEALERIAYACNGLPRCLNQLCDHVLLLAYVHEQQQVTTETVDEALLDLKQLPLHWNMPVEADMPLNALRDLPSGDSSTFDETDTVSDEEDISLLAIEDGAGLPAAQTVCIEVGGPAPKPESVPLSLDGFVPINQLPCSGIRPIVDEEPVAMRGLLDRQRQEVLPAADAIPHSTAGFWEEIVQDRYAALDVRLPGFVRTFEDSAVPESWLPARQAPPPPAPLAPAGLPPAPEPWPQAARPLPSDPPGVSPAERDLDAMLPRLGEISENETVVPGSECEVAEHGGVDQHESVASLDAEVHLVESLEPEGWPIEEQLGSSILDACVEVQAAIGHWQAPGEGVTNIIDSGHASFVPEPDYPTPLISSAFDVIEPEHSPSQWDERVADQEAVSAAPPPSGRYVPKPKYRNVFSTLRRRLGRSLRPQR